MYFNILGDVMDIFDASERYRKDNKSLIILAGKDYGSGENTSKYIFPL